MLRSSVATRKCAAAILIAVACTRAATAAVPSLQDLAPRAIPEMPLISMPVVQNFWGAVDLRHDMSSLGAMAMTPFNGNFQNGSMSVDDIAAMTASTQWAVCEGIRSGSAGAISVLNVVRMPFETYAVQQTWTLAAADATTHTVEMNLDGPYFRLCDVQGQGPCGWGTNFPINREAYALSISNVTVGQMLYPVMVTVDSETGAAGAMSMWFQSSGSDSSASVSVSIDASNNTFMLTGTFASTEATLLQVMVAGPSAAAALASLQTYLGDAAFQAAFDGACTQFEERWQQAFQRPASDGGQGSHFSGNLPSISSNHPEIDRLYYWAGLAMVSLERTNYPSGPRTFVISQGPTNSLDGANGMGGSGQFVWDMSFAALSLSLLDPEHARAVLEFVLQTSDVAPPPSAGMNVLVPQFWDAYPIYGTSPPALGSYRFDFYSAYLFLMTYTTSNNATAWLATPLPNLVHNGSNITGAEYLQVLTANYLGFPQSPVSPWLADYGPDKRDYLEVVPTYVDVVPALQMGNAGMSLATARLLEQTGWGDAALIAQLRSNASAIVKAAVEYLWQDGDDGVWRCMYPNGTSLPVRSVTDYTYVAQALGYLGRNNSLSLPANIVNGSVSFFHSELLAAGDQWVRALSLSDPLCSGINNANATIEQLLTMRADWGCEGSYGGIPGFAVESEVHLTGTFEGMINSLSQIAPIATMAAPSQGVAMGTPLYFALHFNGDHAVDDVPVPPFNPSFPEFFDEPNFPLFWPSTERYIQNAEASFVDVIVRTVFGWRPEWVLPAAAPGSEAAAAIINASLYLPMQSRGGFEGTLSWLRTPLGYINITASDAGLSWVWA
jgi:hypothetical protein